MCSYPRNATTSLLPSPAQCLWRFVNDFLYTGYVRMCTHSFPPWERKAFHAHLHSVQQCSWTNYAEEGSVFNYILLSRLRGKWSRRYTLSNMRQIHSGCFLQCLGVGFFSKSCTRQQSACCTAITRMSELATFVCIQEVLSASGTLQIGANFDLVTCP